MLILTAVRLPLCTNCSRDTGRTLQYVSSPADCQSGWKDFPEFRRCHHHQADIRSQRLERLQSPKPPIVSVLTLSIAGQNVAATMTLISHCLMNCATMLTNNYFTMYEETLTIPYIISSPRIASLTELVSVAVRTIVSYQNILIILMTVILLSVCFIKTCTNPVFLTLWTRFLSYHFIVVLYCH